MTSILKKPKSFNHRQRLETCLAGEKPDVTPVALWRHFPVDDQYPEQLARSITDFQNLYDFDLVKITPASSFCIKDWGVEDEWKGNPEGTREYKRPIINKPDDWLKLPILNPKVGNLSRQLHSIKLLRKQFDQNTPLIQTIFSPMSQAKNLAGKTRLLAHIREYPDMVLEGLKTINQSILNFIAECKQLKIDGIFYAVQFAQYNLVSVQEFEVFEKAFAKEILDTVSDLWLNITHLHGQDVMFDQLADLPFQIINWHDRQTKPNLSQGKMKFQGIVCGGLRQIDTLTMGTPKDVTKEAQEAIQKTDGKRFILGTGCVVPIIAPSGNIRAAVNAARSGAN
jgi:uroporphyrinogen decarboxylase